MKSKEKDMNLNDALQRPVFRRRLNAPHIARLIKCQSQEPKPLVLPHRNTVHYARGDVSAGGKTFQSNCGPHFQRTTAAPRASLRVHQDYQAWLGERMSRPRTGESNRNFAGNSRTSADSRLLIHRTHIPVYRFTTTPR